MTFRFKMKKPERKFSVKKEPAERAFSTFTKLGIFCTVFLSIFGNIAYHSFIYHEQFHEQTPVPTAGECPAPKKQVIHVYDKSTNCLETIVLEDNKVMAEKTTITVFSNESFNSSNITFIRIESNSNGTSTISSTTTTRQSIVINHCNIARMDFRNLTEHLFEEKFRHKKPLIINFGASGANSWIVAHAFSPKSLGTRFHDSNVKVVSGIDKQDCATVNFQSFLKAIQNDVGAGAEAIAKETRFILSEQFMQYAEMESFLNLPSYMDHEVARNKLMFFLGGSGSGYTFQRHTESWNGLIAGKTRWFLYPPGRTPPGGVYSGFSSTDWLSNIYPNLRKEDKPLECVQRDGEILYIPESFYQSTINMAVTTALRIERKSPSTETEKLFRSVFDASSVKVKESDLFKLTSLLPNNTEIVYKTALLHSQNNHVEKAEQLLRRVITMDPTFLSATLDLANLVAKKNFSEARQLFLRALSLNANSWEVHKHYGNYMLNSLGYVTDARAILEEGARLQPNKLWFWQQLKTCYDLLGNHTAAQIAVDKITQLSQENYMLTDF